MNQKELNELRRRFRLDRTGFNRVYGCFVNGNKEIVSDLDESFGYMPEAEAERYLGLLKKVLSGRLGKNLIDIVFSTQQVMDALEEVFHPWALSWDAASRLGITDDTLNSLLISLLVMICRWKSLGLEKGETVSVGQLIVAKVAFNYFSQE